MYHKLRNSKNYIHLLFEFIQWNVIMSRSHLSSSRNESPSGVLLIRLSAFVKRPIVEIFSVWSPLRRKQDRIHTKCACIRSIQKQMLKIILNLLIIKCTTTIKPAYHSLKNFAPIIDFRVYGHQLHLILIMNTLSLAQLLHNFIKMTIF